MVFDDAGKMRSQSRVWWCVHIKKHFKLIFRIWFAIKAFGQILKFDAAQKTCQLAKTQTVSCILFSCFTVFSNLTSRPVSKKFVWEREAQQPRVKWGWNSDDRENPPIVRLLCRLTHVCDFSSFISRCCLSCWKTWPVSTSCVVGDGES